MSPAITLPLASTRVIRTRQSPNETPQFTAICFPPSDSWCPVDQHSGLECCVPRREHVTLCSVGDGVVRVFHILGHFQRLSWAEIHPHRAGREGPLLPYCGI